MALHKVFLAFFLPNLRQSETEPTFQFHHPIKRVAVVGAGPSGLQATAWLLEHNFTVRLLTIPTSRYYNEGDDGLTLDFRWREHWRPRPVWYNLFTNSPKVSTELPDVPYGPEVPWVLDRDTIQRHVRSYASHHCLNSNDYCPSKATPSAPPVTSYSTRRLRESNRILEEWWTETFDAVFLAPGPWASTHVPNIAGLVDWSKAKVGEHYSAYHSHRTGTLSGMRASVLIVGSSVSASEIARDISPYTDRLIASVRLSLSRFPNATEIVPEIAFFEPLKTHTNGIRNGKIYLINGTVLQGIDENNANPCGHLMDWALGAGSDDSVFRRKDMDSRTVPSVWNCEGVGREAQLPPLDQTEDGETKPPSMEWFGEDIFRRYITWLNDASLKYGGRFVEPPPIENLEALKYYSVVHFLTANVTALEDIGLSSISMGSLKNEDPWDALVDEDDDW
ncbi:FAD/NAD-P-binding domain-containing protein [Mycena olivaceomarginata]|nr:FAD/NAD-P-binding domain-containing protein [Mycena olivaceomarginata]